MSAIVKIYTKSSCPYCVAALQLLDELNIPYKKHDVQNQPDLRREISASVGNFPTVPMIFVGKTFIGGFSDMQALHDKGKLLPLVESVRANPQD